MLRQQIDMLERVEKNQEKLPNEVATKIKEVRRSEHRMTPLAMDNTASIPKNCRRKVKETPDNLDEGSSGLKPLASYFDDVGFCTYQFSVFSLACWFFDRCVLEFVKARKLACVSRKLHSIASHLSKSVLLLYESIHICLNRITKSFWLCVNWFMVFWIDSLWIVSNICESYHKIILTWHESIQTILNRINLHFGQFESTQNSHDTYQSW